MSTPWRKEKLDGKLGEGGKDEARRAWQTGWRTNVARMLVKVSKMRANFETKHAPTPGKRFKIRGECWEPEGVKIGSRRKKERGICPFSARGVSKFVRGILTITLGAKPRLPARAAQVACRARVRAETDIDENRRATANDAITRRNASKVAPKKTQDGKNSKQKNSNGRIKTATERILARWLPCAIKRMPRAADFGNLVRWPR